MKTIEPFFSFPTIRVNRNSIEMDDATYEVSFEAQEIDLDYDYDAPQFFDFTRPESAKEAREAECWFESAASYSRSRKHFRNKSSRLKVYSFFSHFVIFC